MIALTLGFYLCVEHQDWECYMVPSDMLAVTAPAQRILLFSLLLLTQVKLGHTTFS